MDKKGLDQLLNQLHEEIKNTKAVDEKGTDLLRALEADIQSLLNRSEESQSQVRPSTIKNLQNALDHFEVTHPNLTAAISELLESLSNAGI
jgi:NurA-like 5'-3' nuclease